MSLYIFILAVRGVCTLGSLVYALKIARMNVTPTFPWVMFSLAFLFSAIQLILILLNLNPILNFLGTYSQVNLWTTQTVAACIAVFFFIAVTKTFYTLKSKFAGVTNT